MLPLDQHIEDMTVHLSLPTTINASIIFTSFVRKPLVKFLAFCYKNVVFVYSYNGSIIQTLSSYFEVPSGWLNLPSSEFYVSEGTEL